MIIEPALLDSVLRGLGRLVVAELFHWSLTKQEGGEVEAGAGDKVIVVVVVEVGGWRLVGKETTFTIDCPSICAIAHVSQPACGSHR